MISDQVRARSGDMAGAVRTRSGAVFPVTSARLTGGLLRQWQDRNRESTIPHTVEQLRAAGNLDNLSRLLAEEPPAYRRRYPFLDTDLYKTLEDLAYEIGAGGADEGVREFFDEVVELLERVQAEDGCLNSFFQDPAAAKKPWEDLAWGHELYNLGHLIRLSLSPHWMSPSRRRSSTCCCAFNARAGSAICSSRMASPTGGCCRSPWTRRCLTRASTTAATWCAASATTWAWMCTTVRGRQRRVPGRPDGPGDGAHGRARPVLPCAVPPELRGIGVRIEDDILVTADGSEMLSDALPSDASGLEKWMAPQG